MAINIATKDILKKVYADDQVTPAEVMEILDHARTMRDENTFELNNMSAILLRSKLTSLKNVEEDVPAIQKAFYKTIKNSTCLGHGSISNRSMKNLIARFLYLSFLTSYRLFFFETTSV
ncbi:MAG: hypothetical protein OSA92_04020 [Pirellulaceae bacterium]|nr:hypothetical protein [Pirellulaceae bacterium]